MTVARSPPPALSTSTIPEDVNHPTTSSGRPTSYELQPPRMGREVSVPFFILPVVDSLSSSHRANVPWPNSSGSLRMTPFPPAAEMTMAPITSEEEQTPIADSFSEPSLIAAPEDLTRPPRGSNGLPAPNPTPGPEASSSLYILSGDGLSATIPTTRPPTLHSILTPAGAWMAVRLVNGTGRCSGRVEVLIQGTWGTVCDDLWDLAEATVVCRQLQCGQAVAAPTGAHFGAGSRKILLDDVQCAGTESHLGECVRRGEAELNCGHLEDAGVVCTGADDSSGPTPNTEPETATPSYALSGQSILCSVLLL
ncbi:putative DMBT1-like protein [Phoca vitulina]|uniref:putative DMBT1-like protein n=1 Tax=Phoca vitulina TaxID=9720 RepID=UPI001395DFF2|nr:putative DMBT1-like protein [Phoca vitulina]